MTDDLERAVELAQEAAGDRSVSVCAANVAQQLLRLGRLDEIELSVVPCLLGSWTATSAMYAQSRPSANARPAPTRSSPA
ncbi:MAG: hypothetical protein ACRD0A_19830 [Acidimicrobiales bacterium]